jgi:hypothetical protein
MQVFLNNTRHAKLFHFRSVIFTSSSILTAAAALTCIKKLVIVPHASHLFEEVGALERVAKIAAVWFKRYL